MACSGGISSGTGTAQYSFICQLDVIQQSMMHELLLTCFLRLLQGDLSLLARNGGGGIPAGHILAYKVPQTNNSLFIVCSPPFEIVPLHFLACVALNLRHDVAKHACRAVATSLSAMCRTLSPS